jgi:hypothetical protein
MPIGGIPIPLGNQLGWASRFGGNLQQQQESGQPYDIPTATGEDEPFDQAYDTVVEQPSYAEDDRDLFGPSIGETTDALGITQGADPTPGDDRGLSGQGGVRAFVGVAVLLVVVYALGQLFTFNFNIGDSTE